MPAKVFQILELSKENLSINEVVLQFMFYGAKILFTSLILLIVFTGFSQPVKLSIVFTDTVLKEILKPQEFLSEPILKKHLQIELIYWQKQMLFLCLKKIQSGPVRQKWQVMRCNPYYKSNKNGQMKLFIEPGLVFQKI